MRTTTVGDARILLPTLDADDLDSVNDLVGDLTDARVEGVSWSGVQLDDTNFHSSKIVGVNLSEISWGAGKIYGCELTRTDFSGASLSRLIIERTVVSGCRFTGTKLVDVRLKDVLFEGCRFDYSVFQLVATAGAVAFTDCIFTDAIWSSCRLPAIVMRSCQLTGLELKSCVLEKADLRGNHIDGFKPALANLHGVILSEDQLVYLAQLTASELNITVIGE